MVFKCKIISNFVNRAGVGVSANKVKCMLVITAIVKICLRSDMNIEINSFGTINRFGREFYLK